MSLDVYLNLVGVKVSCSEPKIFIRENGQNKEISREEWDRRFPEVEPYTLTTFDDSKEVYSANITHNLNTMADEAGIYKHLWRPDDVGVTTAAQLIEPLEAGLALLRSNPTRFKEFNPSNGWGNYEGLVSFVENYLAACKQYPAAKVRVWR